MPTIHKIHSFILNGLIIMSASNIQMPNNKEGKYRNTATPPAKPALKIIPLAFSLL